MTHSFHIPVLGLGFSVDTPLKVGKYGITSVVSVVDDELIERMRKYHSDLNGIPYEAIQKGEEDHRARRVCSYLNLLHHLVKKQEEDLKNQHFEPGTDLTRYFDLLPDSSALKKAYLAMVTEQDPDQKLSLQKYLKESVRAGAVEVNIMSKVDKMNRDKNGELLGDKFSDALASLRGFANSTLTSSIILSAGMNPRLYSYLADFKEFYPHNGQEAKKKIVLKVSDFRSALIQAKFLAKKGLWVHEFRIESGLNCGGHAFATEGYLLGPILQEFKDKRADMEEELYNLYKGYFNSIDVTQVAKPIIRITVQGGIGTAAEDVFLQEFYNVDGTGWGSPFLLVPEATNVDEQTLNLLKDASNDDFYISGSSPLGIPFNNFRKSSAEQQRLDRIAKGRPGSPCNKKFLVSNTEFTEEAICTASRQYQNLKLKELQKLELDEIERQRRFDQITEKLCLCEGLCTSTYIKNDMLKPRENRAVAICPGPNTAYFSGIYSLDDMVKHIYGKLNLLKDVRRPHMFINELKLYVDYLKKDIENCASQLNDKKIKQLEKFRDQLLNGVEYYHQIFPAIEKFGEACSKTFNEELDNLKGQIARLQISL